MTSVSGLGAAKKRGARCTTVESREDDRGKKKGAAFTQAGPACLFASAFSKEVAQTPPIWRPAPTGLLQTPPWRLQPQSGRLQPQRALPGLAPGTHFFSV